MNNPLLHDISIIVTTLAPAIGAVWFNMTKMNKNFEQFCKDRIDIDRTMLRNSIVASCYPILRRGFITVAEMDSLSEMYNQYKKLDGNGTCEMLFNKVKILEIKEKE